MSNNPQGDAYINELPDFSKKICLKLRELVYQVDPTIIEGKKWSMLGFSTTNGVVAMIYAAKDFVTFTFLDGAIMKDSHHLFNYGFDNARNRSIKFTTIDEVIQNQDNIIDYITEAVENSKQGKKVDIKEAGKKEIAIPDDFKEELQANGLLEKFNAMTYTMRKEYIVWIEGAKKEETRIRRIQQAIDRLSSD